MELGGRRGDRLRFGRGLAGCRRGAAPGTAENGPRVRVVVRVRGPRPGLGQHRRHHARRQEARLGRGRRLLQRHSGQCHRACHGGARQRGEHGRQGGEGQPLRRRVRHQVADLRADRLDRVRPERAEEDRQVRLDLGQRLRRARPRGLDAQGLDGRRDLADPGHPLRRVLRGALPDQGLRPRRAGRVPALAGGVHQEQRRGRRPPALRDPAVHRRGRPDTAGHALARRQRPGRLADGEGGRRLHRQAGPALRRPAHHRGPGVLVQQGLRRRCAGRPPHGAVVQDLPVDGGPRARLRRHQRLRRPGLHRRHLPQRPQGHRPARLPADAARPGRLQGAVRQPVEQRALRHRFGRGGQDRRPDPGGVRLPQGPGEVPRLAGRRGAEAGGARAAEGPSVRLRGDHPGHQLQRLLLARQHLPRDGRAARIQLLDPGHRRPLDELALRVRGPQQRRQPPDDPGVQREPRAQPLDGRPADLPGDALDRLRHPGPRT